MYSEQFITTLVILIIIYAFLVAWRISQNKDDNLTMTFIGMGWQTVILLVVYLLTGLWS